MNPVNTQLSPTQPTPNTFPQPNSRGKKLMGVLFLFLVIIAAGIFVYNKYMHNQNMIQEQDNLIPQQTSVPVNVISSSAAPTDESSGVPVSDYSLNSTEGVPWLKGKNIPDSPETKAKLAEKYKLLWNAFSEKNSQKVVSLLDQQLASYSKATGDSSIRVRITQELENRFSSKNYTLYPIQEALDNSELVIAANGKLATLLIENEYSPIFYIRKNPEGSVSFVYYFMLNDSNEFVPIYSPVGLED